MKRWGTLLLLTLLAARTHAVPLVVDSIYPAGGSRGSTVTVTASGKFDKTPLHIWADTPALHFEPAKTPGVFTVKIPADAPLGPHLVRVYTADEVSTVRCFVVGDQPETAEAEPNDEFSKPQRIEKLPALINGQLDKGGDVDSYAVELKSGQTLVASIQGRRLGSAIDPMLHLLDASGNEVAYAQDGLGLDPLLVYQATKSGVYIVQVSAFAYPPAAEVKLAGGKDAVYRLSLTTGPLVHSAMPLGVMRGQKSSVHLRGWNLSKESAQVDASKALPDEDHLFIPIPGAQTHLRIELGDGPELIAGEVEASRVLPVPVGISGIISKPGTEDHFQFAARKGDQLTFAIRAEAAGSALDAVLTLQDEKGKAVASNDDPPGPSHDAKLDWDAPSDGVYKISVSDRFQKGSDGHFYRLAIKRRLPEVTATPDSDAYLLAPGKSAVIKLQIARKNGHAAPMTAVAIDLPPGVTATSAQLPPKSGEVSITLGAAAEMKPISSPIHLMLLGTDPAKPEAHAIAYDLAKDKDKPGIPELIQQTADIWLTVSAAPARPAPPK
jgi:hypothetical protein